MTRNAHRRSAKNSRSSAAASLSPQTVVDFRAVMAGRPVEQPSAMQHRAAFRIGRPEIEPVEAGMGDRAGAHGARLERNIEVAAGEAAPAQFFGGAPDCQHLGMGGRIEAPLGLVAGAGDDPAAVAQHDNRADRHFVALRPPSAPLPAPGPSGWRRAGRSFPGSRSCTFRGVACGPGSTPLRTAARGAMRQLICGSDRRPGARGLFNLNGTG